MPLSSSAVCAHHGPKSIGQDGGRTDQERERRPGGAHRRDGGARPATLLLVDPESPRDLAARLNHRWTRLVAQCLAPSLDRQLAEGRSPESNRLLAARAQVLVAPQTRQTLAQCLANLLVQAHKPVGPRSSKVPLNRGHIVDSERGIQEMFDALLNRRPIPSRGVAMVSRLLADGAGPLYRSGSSDGLDVALRQAIAELDPPLPLG